MYLSDEFSRASHVAQRRRFIRVEIQCRARIRIGKRQYAGYIQNISRGGAKLRTISAIRKVGTVMLQLPDLPPLRCRLRWTDAYHAGVMFEIPLSMTDFRYWAENRSSASASRLQPDADIAELSDAADSAGR